MSKFSNAFVSIVTNILKKRKKWLVAAFLLVLLMLTFFKLYSTVDQTYEPVERLPSVVTELETTNSEISEKDGIADNEEAVIKSFLILGNDSRDGTNDSGRTDAIILAIINEETERITMMSIPRDSYVEIAGQDYKDKINHSFQYGIATTIATVENFTHLPIDHYVLFNFSGFEKAIDALGGISVNVDDSIAKYSHRQFGNSVEFTEGEQLLSGREALFFSRFRYDNEGDFGRNDRQQKIVKAFLDQSKGVRSPSKILQLLDTVGEEVRTDLKINDMLKLVGAINNFSSKDVDQIRLNTQSTRMGPQNLWYELVSEEEQTRVSQLLKEQY